MQPCEANGSPPSVCEGLRREKEEPSDEFDRSIDGWAVCVASDRTNNAIGIIQKLGDFRGGCNKAMLFPRPKAKQIRLTASGMQQWRINKFDATEHQKRAFKRATSWYAREKEKPDGLSSYAISKKVKVEFDGVGPSPRTLQRYANDGIGGTSPLKPGVQSDIPKSLYKSLCIAFESYIRINQLNARDGNLALNKLADAVNNEQELERLKTEEVDMSETALGKYAERMKQDTRASVIHLSEDEWTELLKLRGQLRGEICNTMMTAMTDDSTDGERECGGDDTLNDVLNDEGAV